jgi:5-deoxy-D-glucuronate isomerase
VKYFTSLESEAELNGLSDTAEGPAQIAMTSAPSNAQIARYVIGLERVANGVWGAANSGGFGICHSCNDRDEAENLTVRDNTIMMAPSGYHTVVSAPGYMTHYLWFLAGEHRVQATVDDPKLGWVGRTVPMLKELGF